MTLWIEMGYNVVFFSRERENPLDYHYPDSVKRIVISGNNMFERLEQLQAYCLSEQVDLLVYHDWTNPNFIWECMLMKMMKIAVVLYCHGHFSWCFGYGSKSALYQPEVFKLADLVVSLSMTNARFYQLCGCNSYAIHNPIPLDLKYIHVSEVERNRNHILLIGRIANEKYPMDALKIFKIVHDSHPETVLDIVGDGKSRLISQMKDYILINGLSDSVIFHGTLSVDDAACFYQSCGCVLLTSKMEGYPMILLESKAYGIPLVMYNMPYLSLTNDGLGILTAPIGNIDTMAANILRLIEDNAFHTRLCAEAKQSFNYLLSINHRRIWNNIIAIVCDGRTVNDEEYLKASEMNDIDRNIMPALIEKMIQGYDNAVESNHIYKIQHSILSIPKIAKKQLNKIKGTIL